MTVYVCLHCEYRFDTEKGDPAYDIPAGATPADMPEGWACPECAALGIDAFIAEEE
jgi:hydroxylamine reductase